MERKEQILLATLELASQAGLRNVTLSQIAERVGIRKASLYNHFTSKEEIVAALYEYLREAARNRAGNTVTDVGAWIQGKTPITVLQNAVEHYWRMITGEQLNRFYRLVISERVFSQAAADILRQETERMLLATKQLFYAMQVHGLLNFRHIDAEAISFAMTVHGLLEYKLDVEMAHASTNESLMDEYLQAFCDAHTLNR